MSPQSRKDMRRLEVVLEWVDAFNLADPDALATFDGEDARRAGAR